MTSLTLAVKNALRSGGLDRFIPPGAIDWYSLHAAKKTGAAMGVEVKCIDDRLVLKKGERTLLVVNKMGHTLMRA